MTKTSDEQRLMELKTEIDKCQQEVSKLEGQKDLLNKQLKEDWKCDTIEEAQEMITKLKKQVDTLSNEIDTGIEEIESKYIQI